MSDLVRKDGAPALLTQDEVSSMEELAEDAIVIHQEAEDGGLAAAEGGTEDFHLETHESTEQILQRTVASIEEVLRAVRSQTPFTLTGAEEAAARLLQSLQAGDALLVPFFSGGDHLSSPAREAVNVCILALKIGLELSYPPEELCRLGLSALLEDIGMAWLPAELRAANGLLSPAERATLHRYPEEGARLVQGLGSQYTWLAKVLSQVHERVDGSGYPQGVKGVDIQEHALIVGLADIYESLVHRRPFRDSFEPLEALKEILQRERTAFPDRLLKALIRTLSSFPVGCLVRLNSGEIGRVIEKNKDFPFRPVVEVLMRQGRKLKEPLVVNLSQNPLLRIKESVVEAVLEQEAARG